MKTKLNILLLLTVALLSLWCTGDLMRKNDQATILAGANDLAHGRMHDPSAYYQFDKTYVLYGVCAAILKMVPAGVFLVAAANIGLALIFWAALAVFVIRFRRVLDPLVLLCFLTAPAVLLNTLYVNSSVLSSAFLLLSAVFLFKENGRRGWLAALFFFLAVGSRADVILLLPLLLWLITPFPMRGTGEAGFHAFFPILGKNRSQFSKHWTRAQRERPCGCRAVTGGSGKILLVGILGLAAGRIFFPGGGSTFDPIFNWKMVAGYTVFGFGAAGLLFVLYSGRLAIQACKGRGALEKLYRAAGLAAFLLPVLFFIPQLHAPRYFWRGCEAVLLLSVAGRLPVWRSRTVIAGVALVALLPLVFGVYLPALNRPQITVKSPTLFPSGDGFYPMGAYLPFMFRLRNSSTQPIDHNQLVWSAVHSAQFDFSPEGIIDVLYTPMYGYFMLEASLREGFAALHEYDKLPARDFYADSRSLMRDDPKTPLNALPQILSLPALFISSVSGGVGVLRFGNGDAEWGRQTRLLNRLFSGNEYRILSSDDWPDGTGRRVCISQIPFDESERDEESGLYYSVDAGGSLPAGSICARRVLPEWMSLQAFRSGQ
ncbi:MAG: hypothetical protein PHP93_07320 [Kiritimatiellales bacterium]|nr:hypothetical protein [Kiritimatiellales bacterium]